ncbi:MAG: metal-dependent hydrolase [Dehalococcoidales bacterium]|nr:metal-dependent hydrolase [Dehalococcoidales bacterium]
MLGHTGLTLGIATLLANLPGRHPAVRQGIISRIDSWFTNLAKLVDIRILMIGSMLPDIIDKPIGQVIFKDTLSDGRIFSHTLVFLLLVSLIGLFVYRRNKNSWGLVLAFGTLTHLIFDEMWRIPGTLFWPAFGFGFPKADLTRWLSNIFLALFNNPRTYVPEILGGVVLLGFGVMLLRQRRIWVFIRYGRVKA